MPLWGRQELYLDCNPANSAATSSGSESLSLRPREQHGQHGCARKSIRLATPEQLGVVFRVCCVRVTERHG